MIAILFAHGVKCKPTLARESADVKENRLQQLKKSGGVGGTDAKLLPRANVLYCSHYAGKLGSC